MVLSVEVFIMASSFSPVSALGELISIINIEKNKLNSVTQVKLAHTRTKALLPYFEAWESSLQSLKLENESLKRLQLENESLKSDLGETINKLEEKNKLLSIQKTLTESLSNKSREALRAKEEARIMLAEAEVSRQQWENIKRTTEDQLNRFIRLITEQSRPSFT